MNKLLPTFFHFFFVHRVYDSQRFFLRELVILKLDCIAPRPFSPSIYCMYASKYGPSSQHALCNVHNIYVIYYEHSNDTFYELFLR